MATRNHVILVGERHVMAARATEEKSSQNCPIALALMQATKLKGWGVSRSGCFHKFFGRIAFPEHVTAWIDQYDAHHQVKPLAFPLTLTDPI